MAKIKPRNAFAVQRRNGFSGLGSTAPLSGIGARDMSNFRIRTDGTLVPREGTRTFRNFPSDQEIRGFWEGTVLGQALTIAVVGASVCCLDLNAQTSTLCATLSHDTGRVHFTVFRKALYLLDGDEIWIWNVADKQFQTIRPYVPLYGKAWDPHGMGEVNEPINLLTPHLRIQYFNSGGSTTFYLPYFVASVDSVRATGKRLTDYTFEKGSAVVTIPEAASCSSVIISFTAETDPAVRERILRARHSCTYGNGYDESLILYGADGDGRIYCSAPVTNEMLNECTVDYPNTAPVYIRNDDVLFLGGSDHPVTAVYKYRNALLAFNDAQTWLLRPNESNTIEAYDVVNALGASSYDAVVRCGDALAIADTDGVYLLTSSVSQPEVLNRQNLSAPISDKLSAEVLAAPLLFYNARTNELWLTTSAGSDGSIWVYDIERREWYRFQGLPVSFFCESAHGIVFATEHQLRLFDATLATDDGEPFLCTYESNICDFGVPESTRRSCRVSVAATLGNGNAELTVTTDRDAETFTLCGNVSDLPSHYDLRMRTGRHRFLRFTLSLPADRRAAIHKLAFYANR